MSVGNSGNIVRSTDNGSSFDNVTTLIEIEKEEKEGEGEGRGEIGEREELCHFCTSAPHLTKTPSN